MVLSPAPVTNLNNHIPLAMLNKPPRVTLMAGANTFFNPNFFYSDPVGLTVTFYGAVEEKEETVKLNMTSMTYWWNIPINLYINISINAG